MSIFVPKNFGKIQLKIGTPKIDTPQIDAFFKVLSTIKMRQSLAKDCK